MPGNLTTRLREETMTTLFLKTVVLTQWFVCRLDKLKNINQYVFTDEHLSLSFLASVSAV